MKDNSQRRLRDRTSSRLRRLLSLGKKLKTERQFHVSFPKLEAHVGHHVGEVTQQQQTYKFIKISSACQVLSDPSGSKTYNHQPGSTEFLPSYTLVFTWVL